MNQDKIALKTMGIKARVLNQFRSQFYKKRLENFTEKDKLDIFQEFFHSVQASHKELNAYKAKRKYKAKVQELRNKKKDLVITK